MTADTPVRQTGRAMLFSIKTVVKSLMSRLRPGSGERHRIGKAAHLSGQLLRDVGLDMVPTAGGSLDESWRRELRAQLEHRRARIDSGGDERPAAST